MRPGIDRCCKCRYDIRDRVGRTVSCPKCGTVNDRGEEQPGQRVAVFGSTLRWAGALMVGVISFFPSSFLALRLFPEGNIFSPPVLGTMFLVAAGTICGVTLATTPRNKRSDRAPGHIAAALVLAGLLVLSVVALVIYALSQMISHFPIG